MSIIEVNNLSVDYNRVRALENISFTVKEHSIFGVIGPNGGGKSTLLKALLHLVKPSQGEIIIEPNRSLAYVPQFSSFDRNFPIKVLDVVLMGLLPSKIRVFYRYSKDDKRKALKILDKLNITHLKERQIGHLSGGQLQKVLIARALCADADIILLDEPTANLDSKTKGEIHDLLLKLKEEKTIILITHDLFDMANYIDELICINRKMYFLGGASSFTRDIFERAYGYRLK